MRPALLYAVSAVIVVLDQISKVVAEANLAYGQPVPVASWFNWNLAYNTGAAWSFLSDAGGWQRWFFVVVSVVVSVVLVVWIWRAWRREPVLSISLSLILAGAIGNLIDRVRLGYVIDFVQWYYGSFVWPTFNVADMAITGGAALMIWVSLRGEPGARAAEDKG
ncbi:MAG: signal peptidase II [Pseudomonadota bacterium]